MGEGWTTGCHLGLSASTGELSDNHDVVRVETYVNSQAAVTGEKIREEQKAAPAEVNPVRWSS